MMVAPVPGDVGQFHHGSHAHLLADEALAEDGPARLDAIIVPTAWPVDALRHVMQVGKAIDCPVVALCSKAATAEQAIKLANHEDAVVLALDVDASLADALPAFATDRLLRENGFGTGSDLSLKRNLGLTLARGSGWPRVLFLDDDIHIEEPLQLHRAAALLDRYRAVGLANAGFEDNSVVCHAHRAVGGGQDTFIGGGAMLVDAARTSSFFPNVYNEDWFFLLGDGLPFRAARAGSMRQRAYDPFANAERAASEEFGDTLAEGLFWLLDFGRGLDGAETGFWGDALYRRRQFIDHVLARSENVVTHDRLRRSLEAARSRSADILPGLCAEFVELWQRDLRKWKDFSRRRPGIRVSHLMHRSDRFAKAPAPLGV
jgi:hypothetical protein